MTDNERSMLAALRAIHAGLSQLVQFTGTGGSVAANLRADATFARDIANAEICRMQRLQAEKSPTLRALETAEEFICGFEGDELQEGIDEMLAGIRAAIKAEVAHAAA